MRAFRVSSDRIQPILIHVLQCLGFFVYVFNGSPSRPEARACCNTTQSDEDTDLRWEGSTNHGFNRMNTTEPAPKAVHVRVHKGAGSESFHLRHRTDSERHLPCTLGRLNVTGTSKCPHPAIPSHNSSLEDIKMFCILFAIVISSGDKTTSPSILVYFKCFGILLKDHTQCQILLYLLK
jgi:hypothetical protein